MDLWMKWVWTLAAMVVVACLMALGHAGGGEGAASAPVAVSHSAPDYFTMRDPARGAVDYGVHEGGSTRIYASRLEQHP